MIALALALWTTSCQQPQQTDPAVQLERIHYEPELVPPPPPVASTISPYDHLLAVPPLEGEREKLELETLSRSSVNYTFELDAGALDSAEAVLKDAVIAQLAAHPRWRVAVLDGALVAIARRESGEQWTTSRLGFHDDPDGPWRVLLRFEERQAGSHWDDSAAVARVPASAPSVKLAAFVLRDEPWQGSYATAVAVKGAALTMEIYEAGGEADRAHTAETFGRIPALVAEIGERHAWIAENGHDTMLLPPNEPSSRDSSVSIQSPETGQLEVRARLAPPGPGWTWVRLLDASGTPWEEEAVTAGTRERIGYGEGGSFYLQGSFPVPAGRAFAGVAEAWHLPDGADRPVRLGGWKLVVPAR